MVGREMNLEDSKAELVLRVRPCPDQSEPYHYINREVRNASRVMDDGICCDYIFNIGSILETHLCIST